MQGLEVVKTRRKNLGLANSPKATAESFGKAAFNQSTDLY